MQDSEGARILEEKHMISTLLYLYEHGPSRKMDIYENVSKNPRMPDKIEKLEEYGLVKIAPDTEGKATVVISLSDKGEKTAKMLVDLDRIINS